MYMPQWINKFIKNFIQPHSNNAVNQNNFPSTIPEDPTSLGVTQETEDRLNTLTEPNSTHATSMPVLSKFDCRDITMIGR